MTHTILLGSTVFLSAFLLFLIQPMAAKAMLPTFGGTSAVWVTCLVFYQTVLLCGYAYADRLNEWLAVRRRTWFHITALLVSVAFIPLQILDSSIAQTLGESPIVGVLSLLSVALGLPYLMLSATGPLLQAVHHARFPSRNVYRLYSTSNLASLVSLVVYPFTIERFWPVETQLLVWSFGFLLFAILCSITLWLYSREMPLTPPFVRSQADNPGKSPASEVGTRDRETPTWADVMRWLGLSALGSALLVATTSHMTQNIASIPLFWVLPLAVYLLSFVITFENDRWYSPRLAVVPVIFAPFLMMLTAFADADRISLFSLLTINIAGLLVCCWFLHGELSQRKPAPRYLTRFYLTLSAGGALGGVIASIGAPSLLNGFYEFRVLLVVFGLVAVACLWRYLTSNTLSKAVLVLLITSVGVGAFGAGWSIHAAQRGQVVSLRNFYAVTTVKERTDPSGKVQRVLYNGSIRHGSQVLAPQALRNVPGDYYGKSSGVGKLMDSRDAAPSRVGVIGLGAGVMGAYARAGDHFTFFEINPQSVAVARNAFTYLDDAKGNIDIEYGDARIVLQNRLAAGHNYLFDVLAVDAFTGDAIPVHLLTQEAVGLYLSHLKPDGVLAIHISNKYLDLRPVVSALAGAVGAQALAFSSKATQGHEFSSHWVLLTKVPDAHSALSWYSDGKPLTTQPGESKRYLWTDLNNNLFDVLVLNR
jgi:hypothetical protein